MPRIRPGRVRTKHTNRREPLLLSTMASEDFNVRPGEAKSIACPDCRTWRRIIGETTLKIRPHGLDQGPLKEGEKRPLCPGSDQLVVVNIDVRRWQSEQNRLLRDAMPQKNRRAAQQFYKPTPAPAVPVSRITAEITLETARQSYLAHRKGCARCVGRQHCTDGGIFARRYVLALQEDPARRETREELERRERRIVRKMTAPAVRKAQWERAVPAARRADAARTVPADAIPTARGAAVDGPSGAPLAMIPQAAGDRRSVNALATGILRALVGASQDRRASDVLEEHLTRAAYTHLATVWRRPLTPADQPKHTALAAAVKAALPAPAPGETAAAYVARCRRPELAA
ncbi:hypothetical protein ACWGDX_29660 [Streptomyces sp. NPDC055025]